MAVSECYGCQSRQQVIDTGIGDVPLATELMQQCASRDHAWGRVGERNPELLMFMLVWLQENTNVAMA